ncbi:hypothetical protein HPB51_004675 [Rhipicephalus microplus]|uniref:Uncharacterized protein n=1 Tax=Rhipicephalus microplus TaxID=6941 RepID=A0A9J6EXV5_RHIMP|nr:hypothetical protein HPB51_004675 [Rhipicephalus microplus]
MASKRPGDDSTASCSERRPKNVESRDRKRQKKNRQMGMLQGGKKQQRKNSEDNHRRGSSSSGEQHGDESRYKRLAQELPGFNWLEQKIMGHGGGNFADASPPISKLVTREAPAVIAAPASEARGPLTYRENVAREA